MNKVKKAKGKQDTDLCPSLQSIEQAYRPAINGAAAKPPPKGEAVAAAGAGKQGQDGGATIEPPPTAGIVAAAGAGG